jgi:hypothetical protein
MFQLQHPDDPKAEEPARRLLHMVLLMAARDRAKCLRFEPGASGLRMFYCAPDNDESLGWFELVPAPAALWEPIQAILRESGQRLSSNPDPMRRSILGRLVGPRSSGDSVEEYRCAWSFQLHLHHSRSDAILVPNFDAAHVPLANEWFGWICGPAGCIEFPPSR